MTVGLRSCDSCGVSLNEGAAFCHVCGARTPTATYTAAAPPPSSETRRRLLEALGDAYELREMLGSGGFAEVYLAWDRRLKREVAVKALRIELAASPQVAERFRREAEAIARLRHPHIIPIFSVADAEGSAHFVMPRVQGVSLAEALTREDRWSFAEVCRILREAAGALAAAHSTGIVHRDIKPDNIMLEGPERRVVLMDFGIAKSVGVSSSTLTGTGMMIGTPQYMSPEQAAGDPDVDQLSDQYSLALVGYRLLTGRIAFQAESLQSLMLMQAAYAPTPVRELRPDAPVALAQVIERALAKDPAHRFASMHEFGEALDRVARDVAGEYRRGRRAVPIADRWGDAVARAQEIRRPALFAIAVGAVVTALTFGNATGNGVHRALRQWDDAVFATRAAMAREGPAKSPSAVSFAFDPRLYELLQKSVGLDSADKLAAGEFAVWRWTVDFASFDKRGDRTVSVGPDGRILSSLALLPDSLRRGALPVEVARSMADSVVRAHGRDPSRLRFDSVESTTVSPTYTTHAFIWTVPGSTIIHGTDTARVSVIVRVSGSSIRSYFSAPRVTGPLEGGGVSLPREVFRAMMPVLLIALGIFGIVVNMKRASSDVLQWQMALRVTAIVTIVSLLAVTVTPRFGTGYYGDFIDDVLQELPAELCAWLIAALALVAAESLTYESRPDLTAGLADLSRGTLRIPELIPAALAGYAFALVMLAVATTSLVVAHRLGGVPYPPQPIIESAFSNPLPWLMVLIPIAIAVPLVALVLFAYGLLQRRRFALPLLCAFSALLPGSLMYGALPDAELAVFTVLMGVIPICSVRYGFLAGVIAVSVAMGLPIAIDLLWAAGPFLVSGAIGLALLLAPGAWAAILYSRRASFRPL